MARRLVIIGGNAARMFAAVGTSEASVRRIWRARGLERHAVSTFERSDNRRVVGATRSRAWTTAFILSFATAFAGPSKAAQDPALLKDLTSVIMLLGLPCDQVVSAKRQGDNDHIASCRNGNRYRVFINAEGRVVAQKR